LGASYTWMESELQDIYSNGITPEIGFSFKSNKFISTGSLGYFHSKSRQKTYSSYGIRPIDLVGGDPVVVPISVEYGPLDILSLSLEVQYNFLEKKLTPFASIELGAFEGNYTVNEAPVDVLVLFVLPKAGIQYNLNEKINLIVGTGKTIYTYTEFVADFKIWKPFLRLNYRIN